jgi:hypothetical protein
VLITGGQERGGSHRPRAGGSGERWWLAWGTPAEGLARVGVTGVWGARGWGT